MTTREGPLLFVNAEAHNAMQVPNKGVSPNAEHLLMESTGRGPFICKKKWYNSVKSLQEELQEHGNEESVVDAAFCATHMRYGWDH